MKPGVMGIDGRRTRMAAELLRFAAASLGAGLLVALVAAALVMLLAGPAYSEEGAARTPPRVAAPAADEIRLALPDERSHSFLVAFGPEADLNRLDFESLGFESEPGFGRGVQTTQDGFLRLLYREGPGLGDLLLHVQGALPDLCVGDELADEAHFVRLPGIGDIAGEDAAHHLVLADGAGEPLRAAADADLYLGLAELRRYACNDDFASHRALTAAAARAAKRASSLAAARESYFASPRSTSTDFIAA